MYILHAKHPSARNQTCCGAVKKSKCSDILYTIIKFFRSHLSCQIKHYKPVEISCYCDLERHGHLNWYVVVLSSGDHKHTKLTTSLQQAYNKLTTSLQQVSSYTSSVSHYFRPTLPPTTNIPSSQQVYNKFTSQFLHIQCKPLFQAHPASSQVVEVRLFPLNCYVTLSQNKFQLTKGFQRNIAISSGSTASFAKGLSQKFWSSRDFLCFLPLTHSYGFQ